MRIFLHETISVMLINCVLEMMASLCWPSSVSLFMCLLCICSLFVWLCGFVCARVCFMFAHCVCAHVCVFSAVAFLFNWIGFCLSFCLTNTIAGRYGAICGFGLSLIKWILIVRVKYTHYVSNANILKDFNIFKKQNILLCKRVC